MNSKGEENRSVRLTRKRLSDALITLLMQKTGAGNHRAGADRTG